jgi:serine/threonine protein phosphatase PrpC
MMLTKASGKFIVEAHRAKRRRAFHFPVSDPDDVRSFAGVKEAHLVPASKSPPALRARRATMDAEVIQNYVASPAAPAAAQTATAVEPTTPASSRPSHPSGRSPSYSKSGEIFVEKPSESFESQAPFSTNLVGTFSCHGMDQNQDKINQDCACVAFPLSGDARCALFCVLDGHGRHGELVSVELMQSLYERIDGREWAGTDEDVGDALVAAFEGSHARLASLDGSPGRQSGAAAVLMMLRQGRASFAHAGDSRAVLGTMDAETGGLVAVELTADHKPDSPDERERILATGAYVRPAQEDGSPARVYAAQCKPKWGPGLAMSRSLGDSDADGFGVIPTPTVSHRAVRRGSDRFVILASDGVWEFISSDLAVEFVGGFMARGQTALDAARFLIARAAMEWNVKEGDYRDDITAVVIYLDSFAMEGAAAAPGPAALPECLTRA